MVPTILCMETASNCCMDPYGSMDGIAWNCMELHGIAWNCMELHGIAWNCMELHVALDSSRQNSPKISTASNPFRIFSFKFCMSAHKIETEDFRDNHAN